MRRKSVRKKKSLDKTIMPHAKFLKKDVLDLIELSEVKASKGGEVCGLLAFNGHFIELVQLKNTLKRGGGYQFDKSEYRNISLVLKRMNHEIIGTYHSHPLYLAKPGESDIKYSDKPDYMLIVDVLDKKVKLWHISKDSELTEVPIRQI